MAKHEQLNIELPAEILDLGRSLCAAHGVRPRPAPPPEQAAAAESRILAAVKADAAARRLVGLRERGQPEAEQRLRLRAFAYLANRMLREQSNGHAELVEVAIAAMDPRLPPGQALLAARHEVGRQVAEGFLECLHDARFPWNPDIVLPARALQWAAGGRASLGILSPSRLAASRLKGAEDRDGHEDCDSEAPAPAPLAARQIRQRIAERMVGMDEGQLDVVSGRLAMHMRRARMLAAGEDPGTPNEVVFVLGTEAGIGKTYLCEVAGMATSLPHAIANSAELTASGYVGLSAEDGLRPLLAAARGRVECCRFGLMCYDEIFRRAGSLNESVVNSTSVQGEMLRLVQGQMTQVGGKRSGNETPFWVNTYGMFFFLCGCAAGLDRLALRRMGRLAIGFGQGEGRRGSRALLLDALKDLGIIPELLSRATGIVVVRPPSLGTLVRAAEAEPHGVIASYGRLLGDAMLFFEEGAVLAMARHCLETKLYFRGLAAVTSAVATEAVAMERKGAVVVTRADVRRAIAAMDDGAAGLLGEPGRPDHRDDDAPSGPEAGEA